MHLYASIYRAVEHVSSGKAAAIGGAGSGVSIVSATLADPECNRLDRSFESGPVAASGDAQRRLHHRAWVRWVGIPEIPPALARENLAGLAVIAKLFFRPPLQAAFPFRHEAGKRGGKDADSRA
jgi:hypothetical protein